MPRSLIGVSTCVRASEGMSFHTVSEMYLAAISEAADGVPFLIPSLGASFHPEELLDYVDGILLTGSESNIHPSYYRKKGYPYSSDSRYDHQRDATTIPLIRACVNRGMPLLAICRGLQELNVALGGTLYQLVYTGNISHLPNNEASLESQFAPVHRVQLTSEGLLANLINVTEIRVNSLHEQGIEQLAHGLLIEAVAPDGLIEAVRVEHSPYGIGVQWHPEWNWQTDPLSGAVFRSFGVACQNYGR